MSFGKMMPCQWRPVISGRLLVTLMVTTSPSRQFNTGPGTIPLMALAQVGVPDLLIWMRSSRRSKWLPRNTGGPPMPAETAAAAGPLGHASAPPGAERCGTLDETAAGKVRGRRHGEVSLI